MQLATIPTKKDVQKARGVEMAASKNSILNSKTGKSVVVAFDHGIGGKIYSPNPRTLAEKFIAAQPDGVLMSPPLINLCADLLRSIPKSYRLRRW